MTIKALISGQSVQLSYGGYSEEGFRLVDDSGAYADVYISTPLALDDAFERKAFDVFFLARKEIRESDIFQVYDETRNIRIGWCIPVNALASVEHDFSDNMHFLRYAYVAMRDAICGITESIYTRELDLGALSEILLTDLFHENTALLVVSRETLLDEEPFHLECAVPSLIRHGYVRLSHRNPGDIALSSPHLQGEKLKIKLISPNLTSYRVIDSLLHSAFAYEESSILSFFYLYQIFELLIEEVYRLEQAKIVEELISAAGDSSKAKDALEKVQRITSEKKRITLLTTVYSRSLKKAGDLKASCNALLRAVGRGEGVKFEEYFYSIRNFIFHQYRDFPVEQEQLLREVVGDVRDWLPEILSTFAVTSNSADVRT